MNLLLNTRSLFFLFLILLFISSCAENGSPCIAPKLEDNLIGTWSGVKKWASTTIEDSTSVTFNVDGTMIDNDLLIFGEANGTVLNEKSWQLTGSSDTSIEVRASSGANFISAELKLIKNNCDYISFEVLGLGASVEFSQ